MLKDRSFPRVAQLLPRRVLAEHFLQTSNDHLKLLMHDLTVGQDFGRLHQLPLEYGMPFNRLYEHLHAVALVTLAQPDLNLTLLGGLSEGTLTYVIKRAETPDNWGAGTWAPVMGHVEPTDDFGQNTLQQVVLRTVNREEKEEVRTGDQGGTYWIAGSFLDERTNFAVHVVIKEPYPDYMTSGKAVLDIADEKEHTDVGWIDIVDLSKLQPMTSGARFVYLTALKAIIDQNEKSMNSGRYS